MTLWIYLIDWRTMAVTILAQVDSEAAAEQVKDNYMINMKPDALAEFAKFKTIGITLVSQEMDLAVAPFRRGIA